MCIEVLYCFCLLITAHQITNSLTITIKYLGKQKTLEEACRRFTFGSIKHNQNPYNSRKREAQEKDDICFLPPGAVPDATNHPRVLFTTQGPPLERIGNECHSLSKWRKASLLYECARFTNKLNQ